jgi:hypothetical protein
MFCRASAYKVTVEDFWEVTVEDFWDFICTSHCRGLLGPVEDFWDVEHLRVLLRM